MANTVSAPQVLDREFPGIRCRLIELAAALDRLDRSGTATADDARRAQISRSLEVLLSDGPARAERVQMVFSKEQIRD
jgi:hypothetical protein